MPTEVVYNFEFGDTDYPLQLDVYWGGLNSGFFISDSAGSPLTKNSSGYYTVESSSDNPSISINESVEPGDYFFDSAIVQAFEGGVFRTDGDTSKGHTMGDDIGATSHLIGPITIYSSSYDLVDNLVGSLHVEFAGLELCDGGCDSANNFIRYDEDDFNYIQNQ